MKIWLLRPTAGLWDYNAFVVRAETELEARQVAHGRDLTGPWLDPQGSTCEDALAEREPGILLVSYAED